jgi:hypothetical protein
MLAGPAAATGAKLLQRQMIAPPRSRPAMQKNIAGTEPPVGAAG